MEEIKTIEQGVKAFFADREKTITQQWEYIPATEGEFFDSLIVDGIEIPLFWWRYDNAIRPLEEQERKIDSVSCKLNTVSKKDCGLDALIIRHFDIAEWFLKSRIKKLNCYQKGNSAEILLTMENSKVAILELAATLSRDSEEQGRLTIWGRKGMVSNRVVSQKETPQSIYVYHSDGAKETYNDVSITLYGLTRLDVMKVATITNILCGNCDVVEMRESFQRYKQYLSIVKRSAQENRPYCIKEN